jgi:hypothetical protein
MEGTKEQPWNLRTPSGSSEYQMYRDDAALMPDPLANPGFRAHSKPDSLADPTRARLTWATTASGAPMTSADVNRRIP